MDIAITTTQGNNPWHRFMQKTIELDKGTNPRGYHWFWGLYHLYNTLGILPEFDIEGIQKVLPQGHWLKELGVPSVSTQLNSEVLNLIHNLGGSQSSNFAEIRFSGTGLDNAIDFSKLIFPIDVSFEKTRFSENANFSKVIFYRKAKFENARFYKEATFEESTSHAFITFLNATFQHDTNFTSVNFLSKTSFFKVDFSCEVNFNNAKFSAGVEFVDVKFSNNTTFIGTEFLEYVNFNQAEFFQDVDFNDTKFHERVDFQAVTLGNIASFINAKFSAGANFDKATFASTATIPNNPDFTGTSFSENTYFTGTEFFGMAFFKNTKFTKHVSFSNAKFHNVAQFIETEFISIASFKEVDFFGGALFSKVDFFNNVIFVKATFNGIADFSESKFYNTALFRNASLEDAYFTGTFFKARVPYFYDTTLSADITWELDSDYWPPAKKRNKSEIKKNYKYRIKKNQGAYENLSSRMKKLDKYHDEHFFFRQEMRCRRVFENFFIRFPYAVYDGISDYGYSIGWAFSWWLGHILLGASLIWFNTEKSCNNVCDLADNFLLDLAVSFSNAHGLLPFRNGPLKRCYEHFAKDDIFNIIWGFQTVIGIILLFMLLLTLRIRFRLK